MLEQIDQFLRKGKTGEIVDIWCQMIRDMPISLDFREFPMAEGYYKCRLQSENVFEYRFDGIAHILKFEKLIWATVNQLPERVGKLKRTGWNSDANEVYYKEVE